MICFCIAFTAMYEVQMGLIVSLDDALMKYASY